MRPLTDIENIEQWYNPMMHIILNHIHVRNYVVHYNEDRRLYLRLYMSQDRSIDVPIPDDAVPGVIWPALQVVIKLNS